MSHPTVPSSPQMGGAVSRTTQHREPINIRLWTFGQRKSVAHMPTAATANTKSQAKLSQCNEQRRFQFTQRPHTPSPPPTHSPEEAFFFQCRNRPPITRTYGRGGNSFFSRGAW